MNDGDLDVTNVFELAVEIIRLASRVNGSIVVLHLLFVEIRMTMNERRDNSAVATAVSYIIIDLICSSPSEARSPTLA